MPIELFSRAKNAWNAFINNKDPTKNKLYAEEGYGNSYRPDRSRFTRGAERSIVNAVYNRIAMDVASVQIRHVRLDENNRYLETIDSDMNECFATEANIDQTGRALVQDIVLSMFDEGCVAVIPVDTDDDPDETGSFKIYSMRTAKIVSWKPSTVRVRAYNEKTGKQEEIDMLKRNVLIIENPLYAVVNEPNSTMQRLIRKLSLLDAVDEQSSAGKLDLIIQLPYTVRSELRKQQAMERKQMIENQLANSKYGIAYIDSTEHITQLNRAVENNLMSQIEYLTNMVYSQLGITAEVLNGTADEKTMLNYNNRTIEPILSAIVDEARRKWLTKTARSQRQSIMFFKDPFKLVPITSLPDIADKFTRNEIMSSNEFRQVIGMVKSDDPAADELRNKNLNQAADKSQETMPLAQQMMQQYQTEEVPEDIADSGIAEMSDLDDIDSQLDALEALLDSEEDEKVKHSDDDVNFIMHDALMCSEDEDSFHAFLAHYASKYYDPVYAHQYYEEHKKLKGRKKGLSDEGKSALDYVKTQVNAERDARIKQSREDTNKDVQANQNEMSAYAEKANAITKENIEAINKHKSEQLESSKQSINRKLQEAKSRIQDSIHQHAEATSSRIKDLTADASAKGKTASQKAKIREEIAKMRAENQKKRAELQGVIKSTTAIKTAERQSEAQSIRENASNEAASTKQSNKEDIASHRTQTKEKTSSIRAKGKEDVQRIKDEYKQKYEEEADKIAAEFGSGSSESAGSGNRRKVSYYEYEKSKEKKK